MVHICVRDVSWIQPVHNNNSTQLILTFINVNLPLDGYIIRSNFDTTNYNLCMPHAVYDGNMCYCVCDNYNQIHFL